jgi:hypothetical protein
MFGNYTGSHGAGSAARARLERRFREGMISKTTWEQVGRELDEQVGRAHDAQRGLLDARPELREEELSDARREGLRAQRATLASLLGDGVISDEVYEELVGEVDAALEGAGGGGVLKEG